MANIRVLPDEIAFESKAGETVMGAAMARGYYWPTTCGGQGICTTCMMEVVSGEVGLALEALGEVSGTQVSEALLDAIFRRFCIGK